MNKEDIRELAEDNAIYEFNKFKKIYGNYTDEYVRHFYNKLAELRGGIDDVHTCNCQHDSNSRDNEPCYKYDSRTAKINKAKVNSLEIIVRMVGDKPYYELKYREVGKEYYSVGYSSYDLKTVLDYIDTYFEIVESDKQTNADRIRNMSDEELAEFNLCPHMVNWKKGNYDTCVHPNDKDACKKCMLDWLQSEAE
jgi:hypothetical protein